MRLSSRDSKVLSRRNNELISHADHRSTNLIQTTMERAKDWAGRSTINYQKNTCEEVVGPVCNKWSKYLSVAASLTQHLSGMQKVGRAWNDDGIGECSQGNERRRNGEGWEGLKRQWNGEGQERTTCKWGWTCRWQQDPSREAVGSFDGVFGA